jgi:hypothetical protein
MGSFSDFLEDELLDHLFGCGTRNYTPPTDIYVALSTTDPLDTGAGISEPVGNGYARAQTDETDWDVATGDPSTVDNGVDITFAEATGSWGTISHFALFDAVSGGNMLAHGSLSASKAIDNGDTAKFAAGDLDITLD